MNIKVRRKCYQVLDFACYIHREEKECINITFNEIYQNIMSWTFWTEFYVMWGILKDCYFKLEILQTELIAYLFFYEFKFATAHALQFIIQIYDSCH